MPKFNEFHKIDRYEEYTRSYDTRFIAEISHLALGTFRVLKDLDSSILDRKIQSQMLKWDEQWEKIDSKQKEKQDRDFNEKYVAERDLEAKVAISDINNLLNHTLEIDDTVDWNRLKDFSTFSKENPQKELNKVLKAVKLPQIPIYKNPPSAPSSDSFIPKLGFLDKIFASSREQKIQQSQDRFSTALGEWEKVRKNIERENSKAKASYEHEYVEYESSKSKMVRKYSELEVQWLREKAKFEEDQVNYNNKVDKLRNEYLEGDSNAIIEYCEIVLNNSIYPESFSKNFELEYNQSNRILIVEYSLPDIHLMPKVSEVKYIATKKEIKESFISELHLTKMFDDAIYKITLRTIHEIFEADVINAIDSVVFNGWVRSINKSTGKEANNCILSIHVQKSEFVEIDLSLVDPKSCFKSLKGIGSSKLSSLTAIKPIIQVSREDKRFVSSKDVSNELDESTNLASIGWEDFEHLIRELFEKEFMSNGGEVKVTQASRDGGVDAIAFDPDPIRGGKIVIQAKRYTNTVGVSAVRDLYGTVLNEGATKGILVTTSDYGPDAYEFVKNKPLTLMNGSNLLYLLQKHGQRARIDLAEAKDIIKKNQ